MNRKIAALIECVGITVMGGGIALEIQVGGDAHLVVITAGAAVVAIGSLMYAKMEKGK